MSESYPSWPFACPVSWQIQPMPALLRSSVEDGYPKVRRRFTKTYFTIQATWVLMWDQTDDVEAFFKVDCQSGAQPFYITDPLNGAVRLMRWKDPPTWGGNVDTKPTLQVSGTLEEMFS